MGKFKKKENSEVKLKRINKKSNKKFKKDSGDGDKKKNKKKSGRKNVEEGGAQGAKDTVESGAKDRINNFKKKSLRSVQTGTKMIIKPGSGEKWYQDSNMTEANDTGRVEDPMSGVNERKLTREEISAIQKSATDLFEKDCAAYRNFCIQGSQKSDFQWMEKMMKVGTLPDRMAAYVVKIQDSPIHNLPHLQNLISMVKVQSKQQCLMTAETLKDLFLEDLLPPDKKLLPFEKRGPTMRHNNRVQMIKAIYEDRLKICYKSFIDALKRMSVDTVEKIRAKAVSIIYHLLSSHPEQEAELLQLLVNKLGDPMKKVGSKGLFYLKNLLQGHPRMKLVVIDEVERLLFRNNIAKRAQYYGICFLNSINLEDEHPEVACKLISVYIAFFRGCIKTGDIESKMMSALLTGVNKSYPLAKEFGFKFTENIDTLYKITYLSNFTIGVQALSILFQLTDVEFRPQDADRYYRVLYRELLRPEVATTAHNLQFLNLVFRSMKNDNNRSRIMGFCKRLLQICENVQPNLACSILYLISEVSKSHVGILNVGEISPESDDVLLSDDNEADCESENRIINSAAITNLMKISNVKVNIPSEEKEIDSKVENFEEPQKNNGENDDEKDEELKSISVVDLSNSNIIRKDGDDVTEIKTETDYKKKVNEYDAYARNPSYCGAEFSLLYEIETLTSHYHPSVSLFASELLRRKHIVYDGNPLKDFTTTRFLERFVYKNSKRTKSTPGAPRSYQPIGLRNIPVNSEDYLKNEEDKIPVEEKFFYHFHKGRIETKQNADEEASDAESVGDEEFDQLMADYFKTPKGKKFGEDDEDSEEELDFAANINKISKNKKGKKGELDEDSDEVDDDDDMPDDASEDDFKGDDADEMIDLDDDDDFHEEDGLEVFENDDFDDPMPKKRKKLGKGADMFAPAEQFAEMLEANADEGLTGASTFINKDNANPKQLKWEMDRDRWVKGYKNSSKTKFSNKKGKSPKRKWK